jgi:hypothetical protein
MGYIKVDPTALVLHHANGEVRRASGGAFSYWVTLTVWEACNKDMTERIAV